MGLGTLLIRADASPEIGTGHVMRCLALAQAWQDRGGRVVFFMGQSTAAIRERLSREGCDILSCDAVVGSASDAGRTLDAARRYGCEWLTLDGYRFDSEYQARVCGRGFGVLCVDDLGDRRHAADIILNPNLTATKSQYAGQHDDTQLLLGTEYSLLRREFRKWRDWNREIAPVSKKILVTLGGTTPEDLALCILEALDTIQHQFDRVVFVLGASSREPASLKAAAEKLEEKMSFVRAATDMAILMAEADVAIAAAGATCWEICFMGLPALIVDIAENQTAEAMELNRQGYAKYLGSGSALRPQKLAAKLTELLGAQDVRREISQRCRRLVDGQGAERVVAAMLERGSQSVVSAVHEGVRA